MIARILNIAWKELLHLRKDRVLIPFFIIGGIVELTLIAWATNQPIDDIHTTIVDHDQSAQSTALIDALDDTSTLAHETSANNAAAVRSKMHRDETVVGIVIPEGYAEDVEAGAFPTVRLILNGAHSVKAQEARRAIEEVTFEQGMRERFNMEPAEYAEMLPQISVRYNEDLERGWYTLPAESGFIFYLFTVVLAALAITREKEKGTYEQLLVMPYRSVEVIIGKALAPMVVGFALFLAMMGLTVFAFGVPFRGSLPLLMVLAIIYLVAELGKGILMSMLSRTQLQAVLLVFVLAMVDMIFSGYAVAVETMPPFIRFLSNFVAIRHWLLIVRGIMLKDVGLSVLWPHVLAIIAIGTVILTFTATQYRRQAN
ncbi:MAG: ABC transporter permease [Chloroflexi bacterium]|nr:ABC transporter permease [Chloroflexota bacterium]